jgi:cytoskeleton protein RodZ
MDSDSVEDSLPETSAASVSADTPLPATVSDDAPVTAPEGAAVAAPASESGAAPATAPDAPAAEPVAATVFAPLEAPASVPDLASVPPAIAIPVSPSVEAPVSEPEAAPVLAPGEILRQAREARGESIADLVHTLKLSQQQLEAIESGRFNALPGPTFVRGFVRNYARHLGLDPVPLLASLEGGVPEATVLTPVVSNVKGNMPPAAVAASRPRGSGPRFNFLPLLLVVLLLAALVAAALQFGWIDALQEWGHSVRHTEETEDAADADAALPDAPTRPASANRSIIVPIAAPVIESIDPEGARALEPAGAGPASGNVAAVVPALNAAAAVASAVPAPASGTGAAAATGTAPAPVAAPAPPPAPPVPTISTLRFSFGSNAWIEVREGSEGGGKLLFVGTGNAGSSRNIRGMPPFSLVVSKADKVKLEFNGNPVDLKPYVDQQMNARLTLPQ